MFPAISTIALLALTAATTTSDAQPIPNPGEIKVFKDWSVGCDNGGDCQAISLVDDARGGFKEWGGPISIVRTAGADDMLKIRVLLQVTGIEGYQLVVDGKVIRTGPMAEGEYPIEIVGQDAKKVAAAIARGRKLEVQAPNGDSLTKISLSGSTAALRYIDQQQKRARTSTALIAKGRRTFRPIKTEIPVVAVNQWTSAQRIPATTEIVDLVENSPCKDDRFGVVEDQIFPLGQKDDRYRALILISCGSGAYNFSSAAYIGEIKGDEKKGASWAFRPATYDLKPTWGGEDRPPLLVNAHWEENRQILSSFAKGRGIGDCGNAESFIWDGETFRLIEASGMQECRGAYEWITTWRAKYQDAKELATQTVAQDESNNQ
ncbi:DUF1176 domain-containing protein [Parasphingorhabdus cellanae]|uniref:DUF1176 domain-containing protein n=1 Tax=Parasphingorhabdus cellanae TaxID=2806553 RepID=A0ABX7T2F8_9SPHN|nr:DUF1176 domain-containing protein [Parasphingorhabdus cellanae]QTD55346.1 DUF1176 domain-containing protein [Parasphingorhabdus cellanae]